MKMTSGGTLWGQAFKTGFLTGWAGIIARYIFSHAVPQRLFRRLSDAFGWRFRK
ncbi:hypothetical protein V2P20_05295 [Methylobacter sp. Wu1]|jgi:hypothetical protein|uniref:hypothetical protein n=1 Tax=Methylobacter sp. Wu1 TaxID=3119359 RepID=UPI002F93FC24